MSDTPCIEPIEFSGDVADLCRRIRRSLDFNHVHCALAERAGLSRQLHEAGSVALSILGQGFGHVVVFDAKQGLAADGQFDLVQFLRHISHRMADEFGLELDPRLFHPEEVTQILKDEYESSLFCFVDIQLIPYDALQRLRDFTQSQEAHRCLFCGPHDFGRSEPDLSAHLELHDLELEVKRRAKDSDIFLAVDSIDETGDLELSLGDSGYSPSDSGLSLVMESFDLSISESTSDVPDLNSVVIGLQQLPDATFLDSPHFGSDDERLAAAVHHVSLLITSGQLTEALDWLKTLERSQNEAPGDVGLRLLAVLAEASVASQDWVRALEILERQQRKLKQGNPTAALVQCLQRQSTILMQQGRLEEALALLQQQEQIAQDLGLPLELIEALTAKAEICLARGETEKSLTALARAERVARLNSLHERVSFCLGRRAAALRRGGNDSLALDVLREQFRIAVAIGSYESAAVAVGHQAALLESHGKLAEALQLYERGEALCRKADKPGILARNLANQAFFLSTKLNRHRDALVKANEALALAQKHGPLSLVEQIEALTNKIRVKLG